MIRVSEHAGSSVWRGCLGMALGRFVRFAYARCVHGYCVRFRALLVANGAIRHPRCTPDALEVTQNNDTTTPQPMHAQHSTHNTARYTHAITTTCVTGDEARGARSRVHEYVVLSLPCSFCWWLSSLFWLQFVLAKAGASDEPSFV